MLHAALEEVVQVEAVKAALSTLGYPPSTMTTLMVEMAEAAGMAIFSYLGLNDPP
jgi:hypothetical protein